MGHWIYGFTIYNLGTELVRLMSWLLYPLGGIHGIQCIGGLLGPRIGNFLMSYFGNAPLFLKIC